MDLTCPKCHAPMRTYERNGVHVDQCTDCRGLFLDRGELERLVAAENAWHGGAPAGQPAAGAASPPPAGGGSGSLGAAVGEVIQQVRQHKGHDRRHDSRHDPRYGSGYPRRKKSFLDELFG
jgi:uncharacterized protein